MKDLQEKRDVAVVNIQPLVRIGGGRGFVIPNGRIITAAHCLPEMPAAHLWRYHHEETFPVLGPLHSDAQMFARVVFYDPIADIAVLEEPDNQAMYEEAEKPTRNCWRA